MANVSVRVRIDYGKMQAVVGNISKASVHRAGNRARERYQTNIRNAGLRDTGKLEGSVKMVDAPSGGLMRPRVAVGTPVSYAKYHEYGTRAHGPRRAKYLRFKPKGSAKFVFTKWVRGVRPQRFALNALAQMRPTDFE